MSNMSIEEALKTLTKMEAATLFLKCEGKTYEQIGDELAYSKHTIQYHASNFYAKLGIDDSLHPKKRMEILRKTYCPAIHRLFKSLDEILDSQTWPPETATEPVPNIRYLPAVIEDDLLVISPSPLVPVSTEKKAAPPPSPNGKTLWERIMDALKVLTLGLMTLGCVAIVAVIAYLLGGARGGVATTIRETVIASPITLRETVLVTSIVTSAPPATSATSATSPAIAFSQEEQQTATVKPTQTARPENILFEDDFSDGFDRSKYVSVEGAPIWADGSIRADQPVDLFIGDATWTNYEVRVEMKNLAICPSIARQMVGVRAQDPQNWVGVVTRNCRVVINSYREGDETELLDLGRVHSNPWKFTLRVEDNMLSYVGESRVQIDDFMEGGGVYIHLEGEGILESIRVTSLP